MVPPLPREWKEDLHPLWTSGTGDPLKQEVGEGKEFMVPEAQGANWQGPGRPSKLSRYGSGERPTVTCFTGFSASC